MLVYKAAQVIASGTYVSKPWEMPDEQNIGQTRRGISNYVDVTCLGQDGGVAVVRLKGKDEAEVKAKVAKLTIGKPAEIPVKDVADNARGVLVLNA
jgi:hypothetical protein